MHKRGCIIAAVDLDHHTEGIIRRAHKQAHLIQMGLVVVHAFEPDHVTHTTRRPLQANSLRAGRAWLVGLLHHLALVDAEIVIRPGSPVEVVAALAGACRARYIVAGSSERGRSGKLSTLAHDPRVIDMRSEVLFAAPAGWNARRLAG